MRSYRDVVRPLSAVAISDGSIQVELYVPDQDEPIETVIQPTSASKKLAPKSRRDVDLDVDGRSDDAVFRYLIDDVCRGVQRQIDARRAEAEKAKAKKTA